MFSSSLLKQQTEFKRFCAQMPFRNRSEKYSNTKKDDFLWKILMFFSEPNRNVCLCVCNWISLLWWCVCYPLTHFFIIEIGPICFHDVKCLYFDNFFLPMFVKHLKFPHISVCVCRCLWMVYFACLAFSVRFGLVLILKADFLHVDDDDLVYLVWIKKITKKHFKNQ